MHSIQNEHTGLNKFNARNASCFTLSMHVYICMYIINRVIAISCICFGYRTYSLANYSNIPDMYCLNLHVQFVVFS